jgi:hypothetical protein
MSARPPSAGWRYWALLACQSAGAGIVLWKAVPIYQRLLDGSPGAERHLETIAWALLAIALLQPAFWINRRYAPAIAAHARPVASHFVMFFGRMIFVLVAGLFSVVFYIRQADLIFSIWREGLLLAVLFSTFCYTAELERLGRALQTPPD